MMAGTRGRRCKRSSAWNREWARQHVEGCPCSQTLGGAARTANCGPYLDLTQVCPNCQWFLKVLPRKTLWATTKVKPLHIRCIGFFLVAIAHQKQR
jgi:hypothetical protein